MLMNKEVNCSNFKGLLSYLRKHYGELGVQQVVGDLIDNDKYCVSDKTNPSELIPVKEDHLTDPAYWVSYEFTLDLFANAKKVVGGSNQLVRAGEDATVEHFSKTAFFISRIFSTQFVCKQASKLNARFNRTKDVRLDEMTNSSAKFELLYYPGFKAAKDICNWNLGIYSGLAKMTGVKNIKCEEIKCAAEGADRCVFLLTWNKGPNFVKRLIRWVLKTISKDLITEYTTAVDERDQLINTLKQSEERYRALTDQSLTGIFIHNDGNLVYVNDCMAQLLNYSPREMVGRKLWDFAHPEDRAMVKEKELARARGEYPSTNYEFRVLQKGGNLLWIETFATMINYNGRQACMGNIVNLTSKKQAEEALQKARDELEARVRQRTSDLSKVNELLKKEIEDRKQIEKQIKTSLTEKEVLLREIHHRVKNNFEIVSSILDMSGMTKDDLKPNSLLIDARNRIYSMGLIHTQLYRSGRYDQINMEDHLRKLVDHLLHAYDGYGGHITPVIEPANIYLSLNQAIPCSLVLNELIANAFKHAFKGKERGTVMISMSKSADNMVFIKIKDDGVGIPDGLNIDKTDGIGLKLASNLVGGQLKGQMDIHTDRGTEVQIQFKWADC